MEVIEGADEVVILDGQHALRCCKSTGALTPTNADAVSNTDDRVCHGIIHNVIGKLYLESEATHILFVTAEQLFEGKHPVTGHDIWKITKVVPIYLEKDTALCRETLGLSPCERHQLQPPHSNNDSAPHTHGDVGTKMMNMQKKWIDNSIKFAGEQLRKSKRNSPGSAASAIDSKEDRSTVEEILKLFNEQQYFYYALNGDLTLSTQKAVADADAKTLDEFFWNKYLLAELTRNGNDDTRHWVVPIIQGFVAQRSYQLDEIDTALTLTIISRRSVYRAGTRYIKRGIDPNGHCANFVETEQIATVFGHSLSFVQIRASIPVFWSQRGYKYRPPPQLDRPVSAETSSPYAAHIDTMRSQYGGRLLMINLIDQSGREHCLGEAFLRQVLISDSPDVTYSTFDFHAQCRGLKTDRLCHLVGELSDELGRIGFTWVDQQHRLVCQQKGVLRVNCVDCLDRTNVVQTTFAQAMLEMQMGKLGIIIPANNPFQTIPISLLSISQHIWADNGDNISRQYAGTAALKGDITRSGQRKLTGIMKDGYNSASRYYLSQMRDARRQTAIDTILGNVKLKGDIVNNVDDALASEIDISRQVDEELRQLVLDCQRIFVPADETLLGAWALIDCDSAQHDWSQHDMDTVLLLTRTAYYTAYYDDQADKLSDCVRVPLSNIRSIQVGPMLKRSSALSLKKRQEIVVLKINYQPVDVRETMTGPLTGWFHVLRPPSTRLFNNMAIALKSQTEADEYIGAIGEQFNVALQIGKCVGIPVDYGRRIDSVRSKAAPAKTTNRTDSSPRLTAFVASLTGLRLDGRSQRKNASVENLALDGNNSVKLSESAPDQHRPSFKLQFNDDHICEKFDAPVVTTDVATPCNDNGEGITGTPMRIRNSRSDSSLMQSAGPTEASAALFEGGETSEGGEQLLGRLGLSKGRRILQEMSTQVQQWGSVGMHKSRSFYDRVLPTSVVAHSAGVPLAAQQLDTSDRPFSGFQDDIAKSQSTVILL